MTFVAVLTAITAGIKRFWKPIAICLGVLIVVIVLFRACRTDPKFNETEIRQAQEAIATQDRKKMIDILAASDVREQAIDNSIKAAEEATEKSKRNYSGLSNDQLAAELERRAKGE